MCISTKLHYTSACKLYIYTIKPRTDYNNIAEPRIFWPPKITRYTVPLLTISISPSTCFNSSGDKTFSSSSGDIKFLSDILRLDLLLAPERILTSESASEVSSSEALGLVVLAGDTTPGTGDNAPGTGDTPTSCADTAGDVCLLERLLVLCSITVDNCLCSGEDEDSSWVSDWVLDERSL